jgi:plastocyanin
VRSAPVLGVLVGVALLGAAPAQGTPAGAAAAKKKTVNVGDNYFSPSKLTVRRGTTITWRWPGFEEAGDVHDVKLKSGPRGVKKFHSEAASTDYSFKRKLRVPGTYRIVCTLHTEMRLRIKVRR